MHTYINPNTSNRSSHEAESALAGFCKPMYECQMHRDSMKLVVYIPGVDANSVSIEARGADLMVTAMKSRFVRVNFNALNLESSQSDYKLCLRLGKGYAFELMQAEIQNGVLSVNVPKRSAGFTMADTSLRTVA